MSHCRDALPYLVWKKKLLTDLGVRVSDISIRTNRTNLGSKDIAAMRCWVEPKYSAYESPVELIERLTPLGLLLWWLDDGSLTVHEKKNKVSTARFGYLCTEAFDREGNVILAEALFNKFGLETRIHIDRGGILGPEKVYFRLYLNAVAMRKLIDIVRPYIDQIPECMLYKVNMRYKRTLHPMSAEYTEKYNF